MLGQVRDTLEALSCMGIEIEAHGDNLRFRPRSAMTPDLFAAVKSSKTELMELLRGSPSPGSCANHERDDASTIEPAASQLQTLTPIATDSHLRVGPGVGELHTADVRAALNAPEYSTPQSPSKADAEWTRFLSCAVPTPAGGLRDPVNCSVGLARQIRTGGIPWEDMERFENDCGRMGQGAKT